MPRIGAGYICPVRQVSGHRTTVRPFLLHMFAALASAFILAGCSSTKRVPSGEHLLIANEIEIDSKQISKDDLNSIIKQKPNKKVLGTRFYLTLHNIPDPAGIPEKRARKDAGRDRKNERRVAKGKKPKPYSLTTAEWLREVIGEAPVLFDSTLMDRSSDQMELFLNKEGFFDAVVDDSVSFARTPATPITSRRRVPYTASVPADHTPYARSQWKRMIRPFVGMCRRIGTSPCCSPGARFDADVLDAERTRITEQLKQLGYLFFTRDLVTFDADTSVGDLEIDLMVKLQRVGRGGTRTYGTRPKAPTISYEHRHRHASEGGHGPVRLRTPYCTRTSSSCTKASSNTGRMPYWGPSS